MNQTIEATVQCILSHAKLSQSLWGEAVNTTINIISLSPSVPLEGDIAEEVWFEKKALYNQLKVFGC